MVDLELLTQQHRIDEVERIRKLHDAVWQMQEYAKKSIEAIARIARIGRILLPRWVHHAVPRLQGHGGSKNKSAAKKRSSSTSGGSSGSSGGDGGDGGGDGDGPARPPSKSKKSRSKPRSISLLHPPSSSPGAIANTPAQYPNSSPHGQGLLLAIFVIKWLMFLLLLLLDESKMGCFVVGAISEKKLMACVIKPPK
jgi:hypothetical protein